MERMCYLGQLRKFWVHAPRILPPPEGTHFEAKKRHLSVVIEFGKMGRGRFSQERCHSYVSFVIIVLNVIHFKVDSHETG